MSTTMSSRRLEVQLMVDHPKLQAAELEKLLALPADENWDVGQRYKPTSRSPDQKYQFSRWAIKAAANSIEELSDVVRTVTQRIQGIERNFRLLPSDANVSLTLFVTETDTVFGMGIDNKTIELLARIKANIEISLVITTDCDEL